MILLVDNYDSFVYNLARYFEELGQETRVCRNDSLDVGQIRGLAPKAIVLSPGPCGPEQAGVSVEAVRQLTGKVPILGVCLGHQCIAAAFGGNVVRSPQPVHGRTSDVFHDGQRIFEGLPQPLTATRYHSLLVSGDDLPACLEVTARTADGLIMGLRHRAALVVGVQFHPESVLTVQGHRLLANFLRLADVECLADHSRWEPEVVPRSISDERATASPRLPLFW